MSSSTSKFFTNPSPDFTSDSVVQINYDEIKDEILSNVYFCIENQKKTQHGIAGGLYTGTYGNAYTLFHLSKRRKFEQQRETLLKSAVKLISTGVALAKKNKSKDPSDECGFLEGKAGIYALGAVIYNEVGQNENAEECINHFLNAGKICLPNSYAKFGGDELFVGRAGYLCGALWLNYHFENQVVSESVLQSICNNIIQSGREYSLKNPSHFPLMYHYYKTKYLGAAHGITSILLMLLGCNIYLATHREAENDIKVCVDLILQIQMPNGNFPCSFEESNIKQEDEELVHWCHGGPGIFYLLIRSYNMWKESKYLESAIKIGELVWQKGLLKKGPGICHGIGGSGYVFLYLYKVTENPKYLYRANEFAKFLKNKNFLEEARTPDNPYSLYEGFAGTICFLADLMEPEKVCFPFFDTVLIE